MFIKSIRWRIQLWLAFLLVCALTGFGVATFQVHGFREFYQAEEQLEDQMGGLTRALHGRAPRHGGRFSDEESERGREELDAVPPRPAEYERPGRPRLRPGREHYGWRQGREEELGSESDDSLWTTNYASAGSAETREPRLPPNFKLLMKASEAAGYYWGVWSRKGACLGTSDNAPADLVFPGVPATGSPTQVRTRGHYLEALAFDLPGCCALVGHSITQELEHKRAFALWLIAAGGSVLTLGLGGGWWIARGALRPLAEISAIASRISSGNLSERISNVDRGSELAELVQVLNSMYERLEIAFAQQSQFTADASHELRTPLAVLVTEAQTALTRPRSAVEYRETIETCLGTAQQMRRLAESLLELARFDACQHAIERQELDLAGLVRECVELVHPLAVGRGIQFRCDLKSAELAGDPDQIGRAVTNLLNNAIQYNRDNGEVQVSTRTENGSVVLTVADTGVGIEGKDLPCIFVRFYRAEKARSCGTGHTGLGLAICKAIISAHAGRIEVSSQPGVGTAFTVTLPRASATAGS
jgi:two-component system OmpR family sensor kinase